MGAAIVPWRYLPGEIVLDLMWRRVQNNKHQKIPSTVVSFSGFWTPNSCKLT